MSQTVATMLGAAVAQLAAAGIPDPARDARRLLAAALEIEPDRVTLLRNDAVPHRAGARFAQMLGQRVGWQPVAQIVGLRTFWGREFEVTRDVLDPRPETETLIARALDGPAAERIVDLGTGSGALLVTLLAEWPSARGLGTDTSPAALAVAARNAARHVVGARATFRQADWTAGVHEVFDVVVCNPPYIAAAEMMHLPRDVHDWEPHDALSPGPSGLESYVAIAQGLGRLLSRDGRAFFEVGLGQGPAVATLLQKAGFSEPRLHLDLDGRGRVVEVSNRR